MRSTLVLFLALAITAPVLAQADSALKAASNARRAALAAGDAKGFGKYTTDDFMRIGASGDVMTKGQRIAKIKGPLPISGSAETDQRWGGYGGSTAVHTFQVPLEGKPIRIMQVWVNDHGTWKLAPLQLTPVVAAP